MTLIFLKVVPPTFFWRILSAKITERRLVTSLLKERRHSSHFCCKLYGSKWHV